MATVQERLAASLEKLKKLQVKQNDLVMKGSNALGRTHTMRLNPDAIRNAHPINTPS